MKMSSSASFSDSFWATSSEMSPFLTAERFTFSASMPAPSSSTLTTTWFSSWTADSTTRPLGDLPAAIRFSGLRSRGPPSS